MNGSWVCLTGLCPKILGKIRARIQIAEKELNTLIGDLAKLQIEDFHEIPFTLEDYFMQFYKEDKVFEGVR